MNPRAADRTGPTIIRFPFSLPAILVLIVGVILSLPFRAIMAVHAKYKDRRRVRGRKAICILRNEQADQKSVDGDKKGLTTVEEGSLR